MCPVVLPEAPLVEELPVELVAVPVVVAPLAVLTCA